MNRLQRIAPRAPGRELRCSVVDIGIARRAKRHDDRHHEGCVAKGAWHDVNASKVHGWRVVGDSPLPMGAISETEP